MRFEEPALFSGCGFGKEKKKRNCWVQKKGRDVVKGDILVDPSRNAFADFFNFFFVVAHVSSVQQFKKLDLALLGLHTFF
jgi:hypothetical protein